MVRADERGLGQSPGLLDTMSRGTSECFFDVVEWAAEQEWSSGKVGLLGISYYAGTQWRVAARRPKGLAAIVPWEGMSDYYRDRCRHGGIYSDGFIKFWWNRQVITNQYGRPNRADWTGDTIEGDLPEDVLVANRKDQTHDNRVNKFRDEDYYSTTDFKLEDIEVPLLSVANWGGILLHLRGNVEGYTWAGSKNKWLRFIVGRHDLPFYYKEEVEVQKSFLDAFLKGQDSQGWTTPGKIAPVSMILRKGNIGFNNPDFEANYVRREETAWPIPRTEYRKYFLHTDGSLTPQLPKGSVVQRMSYEALGTLDNPKCIQFTTPAFEKDTEITGHVVAHLNLSMTPEDANNVQSSVDIDVFVTLRYLGPTGEEVHYTGTAGDPVPLTKGWLRMSLRKVDDKNSKHREYLPYRNYFKDEVEMLQPEVCYSADVEVWPTNVIAEKGGRLVFEVSSGDTQGCGIFQHTDKDDRYVSQMFLGAVVLNVLQIESKIRRFEPSSFW